MSAPAPRNPMDAVAPLLTRMMAQHMDPEKILRLISELSELVPRLKHEHALLVDIAAKLGIEHKD